MSNASSSGVASSSFGDSSSSQKQQLVKKRHGILSKKEGAGGKYTWGSILDVTDFAPLGSVEANVRVSAAEAGPPIPQIVTRRADMRSLPTQITRIGISDSNQFPALPLRPAVALRSGHSMSSSSSAAPPELTDDAWVTLSREILSANLTSPSPQQTSPASLRSHVSMALSTLGFTSVHTGLVSAWGSALSTMPTTPTSFPIPSSPASFALPSPALSLSASPRTWMPNGFPLAVSPPSSPDDSVQTPTSVRPQLVLPFVPPLRPQPRPSQSDFASQ